MTARFCAVDSPVLEALLTDTLAEIGDEIKADPRSKCLRFLRLGGGYGRGEGGCIVRENAAPALSNDLDFFPVCTESADKRQIDELSALLAEVSERLATRLAIDADFCAPKKASYIAKRLGIMMWRDFAGGSKNIVGDDAEFAAIFPPSQIPELLSPWEGAKLVFNRAYGLVLARMRLEKNDTAGDFIPRNINKALLAVGDFALLMSGKIPILIKDRIPLIEKLEAPEGCQKLYAEIKSAYLTACERKFSPAPSADIGTLIDNWTNAKDLLTNITMHFLPALEKSREPALKTLKNLARNISLRKEFKSARVKCNFLTNPLLSGISAELKWLGARPDENSLMTIKRIWQKIN